MTLLQYLLNNNIEHNVYIERCKKAVKSYSDGGAI